MYIKKLAPKICPNLKCIKYWFWILCLCSCSFKIKLTNSFDNPLEILYDYEDVLDRREKSIKKEIEENSCYETQIAA